MGVAVKTVRTKKHRRAWALMSAVVLLATLLLSGFSGEIYAADTPQPYGQCKLGGIGRTFELDASAFDLGAEVHHGNANIQVEYVFMTDNQAATDLKDFIFLIYAGSSSEYRMIEFVEFNEVREDVSTAYMHTEGNSRYYVFQIQGVELQRDNDLTVQNKHSAWSILPGADPNLTFNDAIEIRFAADAGGFLTDSGTQGAPLASPLIFFGRPGNVFGELVDETPTPVALDPDQYYFAGWDVNHDLEPDLYGLPPAQFILSEDTEFTAVFRAKGDVTISTDALKATYTGMPITSAAGAEAAGLPEGFRLTDYQIWTGGVISGTHPAIVTEVTVSHPLYGDLTGAAISQFLNIASQLGEIEILPSDAWALQVRDVLCIYNGRYHNIQAYPAFDLTKALPLRQTQLSFSTDGGVTWYLSGQFKGWKDASDTPYPVWVKAENPDYAGSVTGMAFVQIDPRPVNIIGYNYVKYILQPDPAFGGEIENLVPGDELQVRYFRESTLDAVGVYPISVEAGAHPNYTVMQIIKGRLAIRATADASGPGTPSPMPPVTPPSHPLPAANGRGIAAIQNPTVNLAESIGNEVEAHESQIEIEEQPPPLQGGDKGLVFRPDDSIPLPPGGGNSWSAMNTALAIATSALSALLLSSYFMTRRRSDGTLYQKEQVKRHGVIRLISLIPAGAAIGLNGLTGNLAYPMRITDDYSFGFVVLFLIQIGLMLLSRKRYIEENPV